MHVALSRSARGRLAQIVAVELEDGGSELSRVQLDERHAGRVRARAGAAASALGLERHRRPGTRRCSPRACGSSAASTCGCATGSCATRRSTAASELAHRGARSLGPARRPSVAAGAPMRCSSSSPPPADDDPVAEWMRQRAAVDGSTQPGRLALLLAAESVGALIAAEMQFAGLPWSPRAPRRAAHRAARPAPGRRPPGAHGGVARAEVREPSTSPT